MSAANIVRCLSELFDVDLTLKITKISQKERLIVQRLAEIINSLTNCDQFHYDAEVTLDLVNDLNDYYYDTDILNNYSIEFMKEVIDFADAKDSSGKRRRSWKTIKHRYRSIPDQAYISRFRQYVAQQGTERQKTLDIDKAVHQKFLKARE
ncbi:unnamed protein product [Rotaria sp. Silwood2]|nr:unnamed protein product [Rotaria sp. Silwood2]CAF2730960.1 unnamed protein product [Rotaria sp. Silwood2]CAF2971729.1 unnamed protein product [Rotaria sp. Silwood2]CAF3143682.1 unnamed protein product [Rotaria sp. Silwood2]CAF4178732.1 unnamed protein product [Rotaria sp. Silwood2]